MNDIDIMKQLYTYYKKKTAAVLIHLHKLKKTYDFERVHKLRVDIKTIKNLFQLFEIVSDEKNKEADIWNIFDSVFKAAGKIRETEINRDFMLQYKSDTFKINLYKGFSERKEKKSRKAFDDVIHAVHIKKVDAVNSNIKKICKKANDKKMMTSAHRLIFDKIEAMKTMSKTLGKEDLHTIRKYLKGINSLSGVLFENNMSKEFEQAVINFKQTADILGNWHDHMAFEKSLSAFLKKNKNKPYKELITYKKVFAEIAIQNKKSIKEISKSMQLLIPQLEQVYINEWASLNNCLNSDLLD